MCVCVCVGRGWGCKGENFQLVSIRSFGVWFIGQGVCDFFRFCQNSPSFFSSPFSFTFLTFPWNFFLHKLTPKPNLVSSSDAHLFRPTQADLESGRSLVIPETLNSEEKMLCDGQTCPYTQVSVELLNALNAAHAPGKSVISWQSCFRRLIFKKNPKDSVEKSGFVVIFFAAAVKINQMSKGCLPAV